MAPLFPNEQELYDQQNTQNEFRASPGILEYPQDENKFLDGKGDFTDAGGGGGTIEGTLNIVQKGDGSGNAVDSQVEDVDADHATYFLVGTSGNKRVLSIRRLNADDVEIRGENGADILIESGTGGSITIETDGGLGDPVVLRCGLAGSPSIRIDPDRVAIRGGLLQTDTTDIAGQLTLVAGTVRYNFIKAIGGGLQAVVVITPITAPAGILSVDADATGFDVNSSNAGDGVTVNYMVFIVPIPA